VAGRENRIQRGRRRSRSYHLWNTLNALNFNTLSFTEAGNSDSKTLYRRPHDHDINKTNNIGSVKREKLHLTGRSRTGLTTGEVRIDKIKLSASPIFFFSPSAEIPTTLSDSLTFWLYHIAPQEKIKAPCHDISGERFETARSRWRNDARRSSSQIQIRRR
jgi:hypothetical protein